MCQPNPPPTTHHPAPTTPTPTRLQRYHSSRPSSHSSPFHHPIPPPDCALAKQSEPKSTIIATANACCCSYVAAQKHSPTLPQGPRVLLSIISPASPSWAVAEPSLIITTTTGPYPHSSFCNPPKPRTPAFGCPHTHSASHRHCIRLPTTLTSTTTTTFSSPRRRCKSAALVARLRPDTPSLHLPRAWSNLLLRLPNARNITPDTCALLPVSIIHLSPLAVAPLARPQPQPVCAERQPS